MATVQAAFFSPYNIGGTSVYNKVPRLAAIITSSASSQTITGPALATEYCRITANGGAVYAGAVATVTAATGYLIPDGGSIDIGPLSAGDQISIIDV